MEGKNNFTRVEASQDILTSVRKHRKYNTRALHHPQSHLRTSHVRPSIDLQLQKKKLPLPSF